METRESGAITAAPRAVRRFVAALHTVRLVARESLHAFLRNDESSTAAMLAYYGFFALLPTFLLLMFVLSRLLLNSEAALAEIAGMAGQLFPEFGDIALREIHTLSGQRAWNALAAVLLLGSVIPLAGAIRRAMIRVFTPEREESFMKAKLRELAGSLTLVGLFVVIVASRIAFGLVAGRFPALHAQAGRPMTAMLSFLMTTGMLYLLYGFFAPVRTRPSETLPGALAAATLFFLLRPAFTSFLNFNPNYGFAFGSLKAVFLLVLWVYLVFVIFLYGAEVVASAHRREAAALRGLFSGRPMARHKGYVDRFVRDHLHDDVIFRENEEGHEMFFVRSGEIELVREGRPIAMMGPGRYFGELSMLADVPRTATARVHSDTAELIVISQANFERILRENPGVARAILREMATRLRDTDARLSALPK